MLSLHKVKVEEKSFIAEDDIQKNWRQNKPVYMYASGQGGTGVHTLTVSLNNSK